MNAPGYEQLSEVLRAAFDQAAYGKGAERHARGNDFDKQHMQTISSLLGTERGMAFQVCKKLTEGLDMEAYDRFERELLGVIIYTAGIIIWRKKNSPPTAEVVKPDVAHCPHCGASELHQLTCPTQPVITVNLGTSLSPPIDPADVDIFDTDEDSTGTLLLNPANWEAGDVLVCVVQGDSVRYGEKYVYTGDSDDVNEYMVEVQPLDGGRVLAGQRYANRFRFHSRPTK